MISVIIPCYSRQDALDKCLPMLLNQKGVDFEVILGVGPDIKYGFYPVIAIPLEGFGLCKWNNQLIKNTMGSHILILHCDIVFKDEFQLKRMIDGWSKGVIVTECFMRGDKRDPGVWLQCMLLEKELLVAAGGWDEAYDDGYAYEDSDLIGRLIEKGAVYNILETPTDIAPYHLDHPRKTNEEMATKYAKNKGMFHRRHAVSIMEMYAKGEVNGVKLHKPSVEVVAY